MGWRLLSCIKWQVLEGRHWDQVSAMVTRNRMSITAWSLHIQQSTDSLCKTLRNRSVQEAPDKNRDILSSLQQNRFAPFPSPNVVTDDSFPPKLEALLGQVTKVLLGMSPLRRGAVCIKLAGAGDDCGFSPDGNRRAFTPSEWTRRGTCWQTLSSIPSYAAWLSLVTSPLKYGLQQSPKMLSSLFVD